MKLTGNNSIRPSKKITDEKDKAENIAVGLEPVAARIAEQCPTAR
jgi:hypothetical protein